MEKVFVCVIATLMGILMVPMGAFAVQAGGGYIVNDQINNSSSANSGGGFTNQSGGSPISSQSMSGGGFSSFGGAYRNSPATPPAPPSPPAPAPQPQNPGSLGRGGVVVLSSTTANTSVVQFPLAGTTPVVQVNQSPLVSNNPIAGQIANVPANSNQTGQLNAAGASGVNGALINPALFDITLSSIKNTGKNIPISMLILIAIMLGIIINIAFILVKRYLYKLKTDALIKKLKTQNKIS